MNYGYIRAACAPIDITVADVKANTAQIRDKIISAEENKVNLLVLPELCITGYTCADLFFSKTLLDEAKHSLEEIAAFTTGKYVAVIVGLPLLITGKLYNCAAVLHNGNILGIIPKAFISDYGRFCEKRYFAPFSSLPPDTNILIKGKNVPVSNKLIFKNRYMPEFTFGVEIGGDLCAEQPPSERLCKAGALIIANPAVSTETTETTDSANEHSPLVNLLSAKFLCGYVYSCAVYGKANDNTAFPAHCIISENGTVIKENPTFGESALTFSEIDTQRLTFERYKNAQFLPDTSDEYKTVEFSQEIRNIALTRKIEKAPSVPYDMLLSDENGNVIKELYGFFLYHIAYCGETPKKIYRLALIAFDTQYSADVILHQLYEFTKKFFSSPSDASSVPNGFIMPSGASARIWLDEIDDLRLG